MKRTSHRISDEQTASTSSSSRRGFIMPKRAKLWFVAAIACAFLQISRVFAFKMGVPISQRVLSAVLSCATLACFWFTYRTLRKSIRIQRSETFESLILFYAVFVAWLALYGISCGNSYNDVVKEAIFFGLWLVALMLGRYDVIWNVCQKPLLVALYIGFFCILLTTSMPGVTTSEEGSIDSNIQYVSRNIDTVAHDLRPLIGTTYFLGSLGLVLKRPRFPRVLYLGAFAVLLVTNCVVFQFRASLLIFGTLILWYLTIFHWTTKKLLVGAIAFLLICGIIGEYLLQDMSSVKKLIGRFRIERYEEGFFDGRILEADVFFRDMGIDVAWGRGLGGSYEMAFISSKATQSRAIHIGYLGYVLRGGMLFLAITLLIHLRFLFARRGVVWLKNEYNQVAWLLTPLIVLTAFLNPLAFGPDAVFSTLASGFCFSRFFVD